MPGTGRYAPSPTGDFHLGNLRTGLLAWALARRENLDFVIRLEDLDERSKPEFATRQLHDLEALGIEWDGPIVKQSERLEHYQDAFADLNGRGLLYECYCTRRELAEIASAPHRPPGSYPGTCRDLTESQRIAGREKLSGTNRGPAHRLKSSLNTRIGLTDNVCGPYEGDIDDVVIQRGDGVYSYNFVATFDDAAQGITQIVRGDDLLSSTPRQIYLQQVLHVPSAEYWHVPMVLNAQGVRLAKRDGAVTVRQLEACGWRAADIVELIGNSLGLKHIRSASDFLTELDPAAIRDHVWRLDPQGLEQGPGVLRH